jgi:DNA-binding response OmpR family regulator
MMQRRLRVLVIDDRIEEFDGLRVILEEEGFDVTMTSSPFELATLVGRHDPDVLLVDVNMPGVSGETVVTHREVLRTDAPFLLFSGRSTHELAQLTLELGADGYISKGDDLQASLDRIRLFALRRVVDAELRR